MPVVRVILGNPLEKRNGDEFVKEFDLINLYQFVGYDYQISQSEETGSDINSTGAEALATIFNKMADYYNELDSESWSES